MLYSIDYTYRVSSIRARFEEMVNKSQRRRRRKILMRNKKTLVGVKVLEYVSFVVAPYSTNLLADLGAVG
jgi:hypothetical protein